jgi:hypothetical protein
MGGYIRPVSGQRLGKHVPAAMVTHARGETGCCLCGPYQGVIRKRIGETSHFSSAREADKRWRTGESTVELSSERAAVTKGPEGGKLKNLHC